MGSKNIDWNNNNSSKYCLLLWLFLACLIGTFRVISTEDTTTQESTNLFETETTTETANDITTSIIIIHKINGSNSDDDNVDEYIISSKKLIESSSKSKFFDDDDDESIISDEDEDDDDSTKKLLPKTSISLKIKDNKNDDISSNDDYNDENEDYIDEDEEEDSESGDSGCTAKYFLDRIIPKDYYPLKDINKDVQHINETIERFNRIYDFSSEVVNNFTPLLRQMASIFSDYLYESDLDPGCMGALLRVLSAIRDRETWALSFLDTNGHLMSSGYRQGMFVNFGEFDQCLEITSNDDDDSDDNEDRTIRGQYCMVKPIVPLPGRVQKSEDGNQFAQSRMDKINKLLNHDRIEAYVDSFHYLKKAIVRLGVCMPDQCDPKQVESAINQVLFPKTGLTVQVGPNCVRARDQVIMDRYQLVALFLFGFLSVLVLGSTLYEIIYRSLRDYALNQNSKSKSILPIQSPTKCVELPGLSGPFTCHTEQPFHANLLTTFSLIRNTRTLFVPSTGSSRLLPLDTVRLLVILFLFVTNSYLSTVIFAPIVSKRFLSMGPLQFFTEKKYLFVRMFYMVDSLVIFSGISVVISFNALKFNLFQYYVRNYFRFLLPILFSIGLIYIGPLLGSGPLWHLFDDTLGQQCRNNLRPTLLLYNNLNENFEHTCNFPTVIVSMLFQLHLIAPPFLFFVHQFRPKVALTILVLFTAVLSMLNSIPRYYYEDKIPLEIGSMKTFKEMKHSMMYYLFHPVSHMAQFLFGLSIGTLIKLRQSGHIRLSFWWTAMAGIVTFAMFIAHLLYMLDVNILDMHRSVWEIMVVVSGGYILVNSFLCWLIVASDKFSIINRFLCSVVFRPLYHLSYGFYLTTLIVLCFRLFSIRTNIILSPDNMFRSIVSDAVVSFLLSYLIHLMIQQPYRNLINLDWKQLFSASGSISIEKSQLRKKINQESLSELERHVATTRQNTIQNACTSGILKKSTTNQDNNNNNLNAKICRSNLIKEITTSINSVKQNNDNEQSHLSGKDSSTTTINNRSAKLLLKEIRDNSNMK